MKTGITGGIGSGKSYVCQLLKARGIEVYDCDQAAKRIIRTSEKVRQQLLQLIGSLEANKLVDRVIVVTAPEEVRIQRVMQRDGISREKALQWMQRQWPQAELLRRADYEIINDGQQDLNSQIEKLLTT